ncbi:MAG: 2-C-methyl-D-erythritol 2,4-cyclodiphosphate synthase [Melioribacteraceae bacterium]|nr:2-C-methyl-D-erythritol 2,4-cyclodiphosphate synthase [Melioribacteraceae bacterium]MCF8265263.1 2-C-methyl-D-erythritol 2,4-cyclodiphosphate synthase [Melioribacteraceae bacterium]MCF8414167.1 2-C-methyl-D-erythritol 2,4-cyclodiphosphate synthase [Melioribacteraceae bacterium]
MFRIGFGYDVHRFEFGRPFKLGGIEIPFDKGLLGHSDADALLHSITDAIFGAVALGDIGSHFPDTDPKYKNVDSKILLSEAYKIVAQSGYKLGNVDATVVLQKPKIRQYIDEMRESIASILETDIDKISVKATTSEGMGFVGTEEGIKVFATVLLMITE